MKKTQSIFGLILLLTVTVSFPISSHARGGGVSGGGFRSSSFGGFGSSRASSSSFMRRSSFSPRAASPISTPSPLPARISTPTPVISTRPPSNSAVATGGMGSRSVTTHSTFGATPITSGTLASPTGGMGSSRVSAKSVTFGSGVSSASTRTISSTHYATPVSHAPISQSYSAPTWHGYQSTPQYYGGRSYHVYVTHTYADNSYLWMQPRPWYYNHYNPFWGGYWYGQPQMVNGAYQPGGFNFWGCLAVIVIALLIVRIVWMQVESHAKP